MDVFRKLEAALVSHLMPFLTAEGCKGFGEAGNGSVRLWIRADLADTMSQSMPFIQQEGTVHSRDDMVLRLFIPSSQ